MNTATLPQRRSSQMATEADARPAVRAVGIAIIAFVLVALLPELFVADEDWSSARPLLRWTSLGLPLAFLALGAILWRTRAAHRAPLAAYLLAATATGAVGLVAAIGGDYVIPGVVDNWIMMIAFVLLHVVLLDAIAQAVWGGTARVLLAVVVSWPLVAVALGTLVGESAMWWAAFGTLGIGLVALGAALAARPAIALGAAD